VIELGLNVNDLGAVRFTAHPVWETVASLCVLSHPGRHHLHQPLLCRVADPPPGLGLLVDIVSLDSWYPVFLCPEPTASSWPPEKALAAIGEADIRIVQHDLDTLRALAPDHRRWQLMTAEHLREDTATALLTYWRRVLRPLLDRVTEIVEADVAHRATAISATGLTSTLVDLHDHLTYHGNRLEVGLPGHHRHVAARGAGLWFVPSVFRWPRLVVEIDTPPPIVSYSARGAGRLWEPGPSQASSGLRQILGATRVNILTLLEAPTTTTRIARRLALSAGTDNTHLTAMTRAGLLHSTPRGREVIYQRTPLGDELTSQDLL
jgi:DNA-binding transcriptional ArsR family regulator